MEGKARLAGSQYLSNPGRSLGVERQIESWLEGNTLEGSGTVF